MSLGTGFPVHRVGKVLPSASVAPVGGGDVVTDVGGGLPALGDTVTVVVVDVHDPATNAAATTNRTCRARIARTLHQHAGRGCEGKRRR
jgi:hypothetical protein